LYYTQQHFKYFFCKYWPDDGLLRTKLVANSRITIKHHIVVSDGEHIQFHFINGLQTTTD